MSATRNARGLRGFTLVELMVTIAIAAILMTVAAPSFVGFQRSAALSATVNGLVSAVAVARSEAMKTGMTTLIVPSDGADWRNGWVVFVDKDADHSYKASSDTTVLTQAALPGYLSISASKSSTANSSPPYIQFDPSGYSKTKTGAFGGTTLTIERNDLADAKDLSQTRRVIISASGRTRSCKPTSSNDGKCGSNDSD